MFIELSSYRWSTWKQVRNGGKSVLQKLYIKSFMYFLLLTLGIWPISHSFCFSPLILFHCVSVSISTCISIPSTIHAHALALSLETFHHVTVTHRMPCVGWWLVVYLVQRGCILLLLLHKSIASLFECSLFQKLVITLQFASYLFIYLFIYLSVHLWHRFYVFICLFSTVPEYWWQVADMHLHIYSIYSSFYFLHVKQFCCVVGQQQLVTAWQLMFCLKSCVIGSSWWH